MSIQPQTLSEVRALAEQSLGDPESSQHFLQALGVTPEAFAGLDEQAQAKHLQQLQAGEQSGAIKRYALASQDSEAGLMWSVGGVWSASLLSQSPVLMTQSEVAAFHKKHPNAHVVDVSVDLAAHKAYTAGFDSVLDHNQRSTPESRVAARNAGIKALVAAGFPPDALEVTKSKPAMNTQGSGPDYAEQIKLMSADKFEFSKTAIEAFRKLGEHVFSNPAESYPWGGRARMLARRVVLQKYLSNDDVIQAAWIHEQSKRNDPDWFGKDAGMGHLAKLMDERSNGRWREEQDAVSKAAPTAMEYVRAEHADVEQYFLDQVKRENVQERRAAMHIVETSQDDSPAPGM